MAGLAAWPTEASAATVVVTSDQHDVARLSSRLQAYADRWLPVIERRLQRPVREKFVGVFITSRVDLIGETSGNVVRVSVDHLRRFPADIGLLAHELTHVVQAYPRATPLWLTEGIADFIRYYVVEPGSPKARFNAGTASYLDGYAPAAGMLNWLERRTGPHLLPALNAMMVQGAYSSAAFERIAGLQPSHAWDIYRKELAR
jgi:hypothetical protein